MVDRRLVDLIRVQQASLIGLKVGFKGLDQKEHESRGESLLAEPT